MQATWNPKTLSALGSVTPVSRIPFKDLACLAPHYILKGTHVFLSCLYPLQTCHVLLNLSALVCAIFSVWNVLVICPPGEIIIVLKNPYPAALWIFLSRYVHSFPSVLLHAFIQTLLAITCLVPIFMYTLFITSKKCWIRRLWWVGGGGYFSDSVKQGISVVRE